MNMDANQMMMMNMMFMNPFMMMPFMQQNIDPTMQTNILNNFNKNKFFIRKSQDNQQEQQ